jgi:hypothetical protein
VCDCWFHLGESERGDDDARILRIEVNEILELFRESGGS